MMERLPDLPAGVDAGVLHPAVVAPFAGVVHVGLALLEEHAVTRVRVRVLGLGDVGVGILVSRSPVGKLDGQPFLLEQALFVCHQFTQALKRRGALKNQLFHRALLIRWICVLTGPRQKAAL